MKGADYMADEKQLIDIEALSHFKAKQDVENAKKFKSKDDATDLKGAVRYDTAQALTPEEKEQARQNIGIDLSSLGSGGGTGVSDYNELLNRPVYGESFHSYFDGNETPNPDIVTALGNTLYKVSDLTPTKEQLFSADLSFNGYLEEEKLTEANILATFEKDGEIVGLVVAISEVRTILVAYTTETVEGTVQSNQVTVSVPSVGIYWGLVDGVANKTFEIEYGEIKRLDDMYIPHNIPRLNENGVIPARNLPLIPAEKLPSYVDDVVEGYGQVGKFSDAVDQFFASYSKDELGVEHWGITITPETGKIYLDLFTNNTYRWSGSQYVRINPDEYTVATNADIDALFT